jgi:endosialidase-like protein
LKNQGFALVLNRGQETIMKIATLSAIFCTAIVCSVSAFAQTDTTFSYQGELQEMGVPANGSFNLEFSLFDALSGGSQIGSTVTIAAQAVSDGIFRSQLDFGAQDFSGTPFWLEIVVDGTTLSPRQSLTASPYSIQTRGIFVDENNKVGIGTSNQLAQLHVESASFPFRSYATGVSGGSYAGLFDSASTSGVGVFGVASADTGITYGGRFQNFSTSGYGVHGQSYATNGATYGVYGRSASSSGHGVYGWATAATGFNYGGKFESPNSTSGRGVYGRAGASTGTTYGGYFRSESTSGRGVYGEATATSGTTTSVWGANWSTAGRAVFGQASATSGLNYGVFGTTGSTSGRGVFGEAPASTGQTYGVYGKNQSTGGRGVYGEATASTGATYGVSGVTRSTSGFGVFGRATSTSGTSYGVRGQSNSPSGYDFFASGAGTNYGSTSSRRWKNNIVNIDNPLDKLAKLRGVYYNWDNDHGGQHDIGMIAEEVGKILPEIVNYEENGVDAIGMDYSKMTPLLVEATNALRAEKDVQIMKLKDENERLKVRLDRLERMMVLIVDK